MGTESSEKQPILQSESALSCTIKAQSDSICLQTEFTVEDFPVEIQHAITKQEFSSFIESLNEILSKRQKKRIRGMFMLMGWVIWFFVSLILTGIFAALIAVWEHSITFTLSLLLFFVISDILFLLCGLIFIAFSAISLQRNVCFLFLLYCELIY
jgi:hypothetical protein